MRIQTLHTGSSGNSYFLIDEDGNILILDCGVNIKQINSALGYDISKVNGVLVSHEHKDHSLSADALELYGLPIFRPYLTESGMDKKTLGVYAVSSFPVEHDGTPCCGFYIKHKSGFKMLYVTDLELTRYRFTSQKVNFILCECNWQKEYVDEESASYRHKVLGHMSLDGCLGFIKANATESLQTVAICHMSKQTVDVSECLEKIKELLPEVNVYAAENNTTFQL